ncbi:MAG TPA: MotA/TolQ/ExbB proton channel family protein [Candidatus Acidoferrum sp.]|nr:MotA/TolQ/ExbB proton channel family protein [Candidatus Acidoferrum sp.]
MMIPIILASIIAIAIIIERFWSLNAARIAPRNTLAEVWGKLRNSQLDAAQLRDLRMASPLGQILAAGLVNAKAGRAIMIESIELAASHVVHDMERYLSTLGTIAAMSPLMGLLGTVFGMIKIFSESVSLGAGDPKAIAGGIAVALVSTAGGLVVAIPSLFFHRYFVRKVEGLVVELERESIKLVDALYSNRAVEVRDA